MIETLFEMIRITLLNLALGSLLLLSVALMPDAADYVIHRRTPIAWIQRFGMRAYLKKRAISLLYTLFAVLILAYLLDRYSPIFKHRLGTVVSLTVIFIARCIYEAWRKAPPQKAEHIHEKIPPSSMPLITRAEIQHLQSKTGNAPRDTIFFASLPVRQEVETHHFKLIGNAGIGKSAAIKTLLQGALMRGDRVVIADAEGETLSTLYQPDRGDIILNPLDARSPSEVQADAPTLHPEASIAVLSNWIRAGTGCLFLPYYADQAAWCQLLIRTWLQQALQEITQLEKQDNRLWFFIDELDTLGYVQNLPASLATVAAYGGRMVIGFQSLATLHTLYHADTERLIEQCQNTLITKCPQPEQQTTRVFASTLIGKKIVPASELEQMAEQEGYVKLSASLRWFKVALNPYVLPKITPAFEGRSISTGSSV